jgi:hypothetical protein
MIYSTMLTSWANYLRYRQFESIPSHLRYHDHDALQRLAILDFARKRGLNSQHGIEFDAPPSRSSRFIQSIL